jgi:hypothetical protein
MLFLRESSSNAWGILLVNPTIQATKPSTGMVRDINTYLLQKLNKTQQTELNTAVI